MKATYSELMNDILNDTAYLKGLKRGYTLGSSSRTEEYNQEMRIYSEALEKVRNLIKDTPEFKLLNMK